MNLMIKPLHPDFRAPRYATAGSAGADLHAIERGVCNPGEIQKIRLGFAVAIPEGFAMLMSARSSHGMRYGAQVPHGYGLIDSDYRGELFMMMQTKLVMRWEAGDRICQVIVVPVVHARFDIVNELPWSARGTGGFGSTGQ